MGNPNNQAYDEAIDWVIALKEAPDDSDVAAAFLSWLDERPENAEAWARAEQAQLHAQTPEIYIEPAPFADTNPSDRRSEPAMALPQPLAAKHQSHRLAKTFLSAALAIAACLAVVVTWPMFSLMLRADHMTANGEFRELRLDDGSAVKLGGGSAIAVNFSNQTREVELLRGAAFFLVHTDAERPFVVRSAKILTRAVGTAFEVRRTASGSSIAVAEGIVEVAQDKPSPSQEKAKQISLRLTAGRQLAISVDEGAATLDAQNVDINEIASWQKGQLAFNNWLVADVVDALRRNYRGLIVIQPGLLTKGRISGVHDLRKPIASLRLLAATQGLRVRQISPWFTTVSRF